MPRVVGKPKLGSEDTHAQKWGNEWLVLPMGLGTANTRRVKMSRSSTAATSGTLRRVPPPEIKRNMWTRSE
jgi:hypothetical protein